MGIFRSTDPTVWDDVDGIIINESAPAPNVAGVAANVGILVGQTQRGPAALTQVNSIGEFLEKYGKDDSKGVNISLKNKKFGVLKIIRVIPADAALATKNFASSATDRIKFDAKQGKGAYGNNIQVKIEDGSTAGKKYTIHDNNTGAVLPDEVYDNVEIAEISSDTFANSNLVTVTVLSSAAEPTNAAFTNLASGADGTAVDTDYEDAIALAEVENAGNFIFLDAYNDTRNGYLKLHCANTQDKMAILAGAEDDDDADAIADVASFRDTEGRLIYAWPWVQTTIGGVLTWTNPASWLASILTQTAPHLDPANVKNSDFVAGIVDLKYKISRTGYAALMSAGICAFERTRAGDYKPKSGIVTQTSDSSKVTILRRRMADFLTVSVAQFLESYQNKPNTKENRTAVKASMVAFVESLEKDGVLPKDSEIINGKAKLIDTESLNTNSSIAAGFFKILWKQRIYSSMRFIVLSAEIGQSVVVTEQE